MPRNVQAGRSQHGGTTWEPNHPPVGGGGPCIHLGVMPRRQAGPLVRVELRRVGVVADQAGAVTAGEAVRAAHAAEADFAGGELRFYGREQTPTRTRPARPCLRWCCRGAGRRLSSRRAGRTCTRWPASPPASATHFPPSLRPNSPRRPLRGGLISGAARPSAAPPVRRRCGSSG